jgi:hypothetical protein
MLSVAFYWFKLKTLAEAVLLLFYNSKFYIRIKASFFYYLNLQNLLIVRTIFTTNLKKLIAKKTYIVLLI